jgi:sarcosine oxidase subunit beta
VGEQRIAASWCGLEAEAFDDVPLIGPAVGVEGLFLAVGFSGHGFAISPAVGEALAEELLGRPAAALGGLRPSRAAGLDREAVERFRAGLPPLRLGLLDASG